MGFRQGHSHSWIGLPGVSSAKALRVFLPYVADAFRGRSMSMARPRFEWVAAGPTRPRKTGGRRSRGNRNPLSLGLSGISHHYKQPLARRYVYGRKVNVGGPLQSLHLGGVGSASRPISKSQSVPIRRQTHHFIFLRP